MLDPLPWAWPIPWFLAQTDLPPGIECGYRGATSVDTGWAQFTAADGSWCTVRLQPGDSGHRDVCWNGPTATWQ